MQILDRFHAAWAATGLAPFAFAGDEEAWLRNWAL
jgi:hypothetical protein